jgi:putative hydrolase of the HAD superfamily
MLKEYSVIAFDLDFTLYDEREYYKKVFKEMSIYLEKEGLSNADMAYCVMVETLINYGTQQPVFKLSLKKLGIYSSDLDETFFDIYKSVDCSEIQLYEDAHDFIDYLYESKHDMAIITNGVVEAQKNKIRQLDLERFVDYICFAREEGKKNEKPSQSPFKKVCKKFKILPAQMIFVGDNPATDFIGSKLLGIFNVRLLRGEFKDVQLESNLYDMEIRDFYELKNFLCSSVNPLPYS